jgi:hypothetical protein
MEYLDKKKSLKERKELYKAEVLNKQLNPIKNFNPETFDPLADDTEEYKVAKRERKDPPKELPTMGMKPKELLEGQMIGMYESKQDLYLLFAHKCNELQKRIDNLEKLINKK